MERRHWLALAVLALLPLATLWGWQVVTDPGFRAGDSPSAASLHVAEAEAGEAPPADSDAIVAFDALTAGQQRVFERALGEGYAEIPPDVDDEVWIDSEYVRYRNETYAVAVAVP
jgi:hypothetical protein